MIKRPTNRPTTDAEIIRAIGIDVLVDNYGFSRAAVLKWVQRSRGIPWQHRHRIRQIAGYRKIKAPRGFLEIRQ